jgi:hypothetical protein
VTEVAVDASKPLGVLALPAGAERPEEAPYWMANAPSAAAVVPVDAATATALATGTTYTAVTAGGAAPVELTAGAPTTIGYGCDQNDLSVVPLTGPASPKPGLLWVLPAPMPAGWSPRSHVVVGARDARERLRVRAAAVSFELVRRDMTRAQMRISVRQHPVHLEEVEAYVMDGADPIDLDFTQEGHVPGVPMLEAVFSFGDAGPYVVVLDRSGYEGVAFQTLLLQDGKAREIESLGLGAYYCAF